MSGVIRFDISAYLKIVLHASKYPSECIGGFLIRNVGSSSDNNISDAIPVYHGAPVAPLLEFAAETTSAMNMHIIGVYFANEIASNKIAPLFVERMCESVALKNSGVCILAQLDGNLLGEKTQLCINCKAGNRSYDMQMAETPQEVNKRLDDLLGSGGSRELSDVQDHFDSPKKDFRNQHIR